MRCRAVRLVQLDVRAVRGRPPLCVEDQAGAARGRDRVSAVAAPRDQPPLRCAAISGVLLDVGAAREVGAIHVERQPRRRARDLEGAGALVVGDYEPLGPRAVGVPSRFFRKLI